MFLRFGIATSNKTTQVISQGVKPRIWDGAQTQRYKMGKAPLYVASQHMNYGRVQVAFGSQYKLRFANTDIPEGHLTEDIKMGRILVRTTSHCGNWCT